MSEDTVDVLVAAYRDLDAAGRDFDAVTELVRTKRVTVEGVILVEHGGDGRVRVVGTGDHLGRKGLGWGAGVGLVVGLFQPELLGAVAVGAGAGGLVGRFVEHRLTSGLGDKVGEALPPGSAGVVTVFPTAQRLTIEQALSGSLATSVVAWPDRRLLRSLLDSLAEAMHKFSPDRTVLPIPDRAFGGTMGRTWTSRCRAGAS